MNKPTLRKHVAKLLTSMTKVERHRQSRAIFEKLIELHSYKKAKRISIYLSTEYEVDTKPILRHALEIEGKQCYIPLIKKGELHRGYQKTRMTMIELKSMQEYEELPKNHYNIKEPRDPIILLNEADPHDNNLDLIIVPGVAFSRAGQRLGHGKGYYDEFLFSWCKQTANSRTVGLAFLEQLIEKDLFPLDESDFTLEHVLTPDC